MNPITPLTDGQITQARQALAAYSRHAPTGFTCCAAHPAADAAALLLPEITRLQAELAAFSGHANLLEARLCTCEPVRAHDDYTQPAFYQHAPDCRVTELLQDGGQ